MKNIASSAELRGRVGSATMATWPILLAVTAVINLISFGLNQGISLLPEPLRTLLPYVVTALLMVPSMGLLKGTIEYLRGKPLTFECIKVMFPYAWKMICYYLWETLCMIGWMLLGVLPMIVGALLIALLPDAGMLGAILVLVGLVLMIVLGARATLDYSMSGCILTEDPTMGVDQVLRESRKMIRGYRWHFVKMSLPLTIFTLIVGLILIALFKETEWLMTISSTVLSLLTGVMSRYFAPVMYEELRCIGR